MYIARNTVTRGFCLIGGGKARGASSVTPQEKKIAKYHQQFEREGKISLWFALAILMFPAVAIGVFLGLAH